MKTSFEKAVEFILQYEGGYSNDLRDPGGETNWGISKRKYQHLDIRNLTRDEAIAIYEKDYWKYLKCDQLPYPLAFLTFDAGVNQGEGAAAYMLQETLGIKQDGIIGMVTIQTALKANLKESVIKYTALRMWRYSAAKNVAIYGRGWFNRLAACVVAATEPPI